MMAETMNEASGTNNTSTIVSTKRLMTDKDDDDDGIGADSEKNDRFEYKRSKLMTSQSPNLDEFLLELLQQNNDDSAGKIELKMSLDAIFYPKFENELPDQKIRQQMLAGVSTQKGYLEISLKHSGNLILWNGSTFYSKNSTNNIFTYTAEILLRQHFAKLGFPNSTQINNKFRECATYLKTHRLCLSFECVTAFLGHHGDIPKQDFLILTAVADLQDEERFFTTYELISFAHQWRLPHNDVWIYTSPDRCQRVFDIYDYTRETGTAHDTVQRLCDSANIYIPCMYPHCEAQGDILEGIVIRYLDYCHDSSGACENLLFDLVQPLAQEAKQIAANLKESNQQPVSDTCPLSILLGTNLRDLFLTSMSGEKALQTLQNALQRIDEIELQTAAKDEKDGEQQDSASSVMLPSNKYHKYIGRTTTYQQDALGSATMSSNFENVISNLVCEQQASEKFNADQGKEERVMSSSGTIQLSKDTQTQRIAKLIHTLHQFSLPVVYNFFRSLVKPSRWIFILQVRIDSVFTKYRKKILSSQKDIINSEERAIMHLYRGFAVRLTFGANNGPSHHPPPSFVNSSIGTAEEQAELKKTKAAVSARDSQPLMLKMKFLPYMVRTFGCRNGLSTLMKSGIIEYDNYVANLLSRWNISQSAMTKWQNTLHFWGKYALEKIQHTDSKIRSDDANEGSTDVDKDFAFLNVVVSDNDFDLKGGQVTKNLPLNSATYLYHLKYFLQEYSRQSNQQKLTCDGCEFQALIFVVCFERKYAQTVSEALSQILSCPCIPFDQILGQKNVVISSQVGFVSYCSVSNGANKMRQLLTKYQQRCIILLLSPTSEELHQHLLDRLNDSPGDSDKVTFSIDKEKKKILGMSTQWKTLKCAILERGPISSFFPTGMETSEYLVALMKNELSTQVSSLLKDLKHQIDSIPKPDLRPGILVFFPLIPGSGKSTWCEVFTPINPGSIRESATIFHAERISNGEYELKVSALFNGQHRDVVLQMSDQMKGERFWPFVRQQKLSCTSSIFIADKNAPPNAWPAVTDIVSESRNFSVAVLPDNKALSTTSVVGTFSRIEDIPGKSLSVIRHSYPFSLTFLAVCISRVLTRPLATHPEMIDDFICHGESDSSIVRIPFFLDDCSMNLPEELEQCLIDALRLQFELDKRGEYFISTELPTASTEIERRLRESVTKYTPLLQSMTVSVEVSQQSFLVQLSNVVLALLKSGAFEPAASLKPLSRTIRIVSIDLDVVDVHRLIRLEALFHSDLANLMKQIGELDENKCLLSNDNLFEADNAIDHDENKDISRWIIKTHVTMVHSSQSSQNQMRNTFESSLGRSFDVTVSGIHFSSEVAALDVTEVRPITTADSSKTKFPQPANEYPHVTIWCSAGVEPYQSNTLPQKLRAGEANRITFQKPTVLRGTLSFWEEPK